VSERGLSLHIAALPFPSPQGTQAVLATMLRALNAHDRTAALFCYAHGQQRPGPPPPFPIYRSGTIPGVTPLRSGPHPGKLLLDARLSLQLPALERRLEPELLVAHHVEAALATLPSRRLRIFFAHTDLGAELPHYVPRYASKALGLPARLSGAALDAFLLRRFDAVATVSPLLASRLKRLAPNASITPLPLPWPVDPDGPPCHDETQRALCLSARRLLALPESGALLLYAGNLDGYQGWQSLLDALALLASRQSDVHLLIASDSDGRPVLQAARRRGLAGRVHLRKLGDELLRVQLHRAAQLALVPRRAPGGLPIKLLDAMGRGLATVATVRATAGLPVQHAVEMVKDDDVHAMAAAVHALLADAPRRRELGTAAQRHIRDHHSEAGFARAFRELAEEARARRKFL